MCYVFFQPVKSVCGIRRQQIRSFLPHGSHCTRGIRNRFLLGFVRSEAVSDTTRVLGPLGELSKEQPELSIEGH